MSSSSILSVSEKVLSLLLLALLAFVELAVLSSSSSSHVASASFPSAEVPGYFFRYSEGDLRI